MSSPAQQLKHRGAKPEKKNTNGLVAQKNESLDEVLKSVKSTATSEWDYKVALVIITLMAFATRFWGIGHPDQVVFDEVHFGKVSRENATLPSLGFKQEICQ
jgi:dolichyl-phosphate-mannose-protein mannosyltransferase